MTHLVKARPCASALLLCLALGAALVAPRARAGAQVEEQLAPSVVAGLALAVADLPAPVHYVQRGDVQAWIETMSPLLAGRIPAAAERNDLLATVHYEATRAGLDPELVLAVIHHESGFHKYAVSSTDARGYMQVMPFWTRLIGNRQQDLFHLRTNLRYGCTILRYYLGVEHGDLYRALGRYNGSLGSAEYPNAVMAALTRYRVPHDTAPPRLTPVSVAVPAR